MEKQIQLGKRLVLGIVVLTLFVSIFIAVYTGYYVRATNIVRFVFTCLLLYYLYKGHKWAKTVSIILYGLSGLIGLYSLILFQTSFVLVFMSLSYVTIASLLIFSKSVNKFFKYQRGEIVQEQCPEEGNQQ